MRRQEGFTLIELLVVVALIAMLTVLLLPVLTSAREQVWRTRCLSNVRQIAQAHLMYLQDWDEQLAEWWSSGPPRPEPYRSRRYWTEFLQPYLRSERVLHDPGYQGPQAPPRGLKLAEYAFCTWGSGGSGWPNDPYWRWPGPPLFLAQVRRPAETVSLTDGYTTTERTRVVVARHHQSINVSFLDGHAKWLREGKLYEMTDDRGGPYQHERWYFLRYITADR